MQITTGDITQKAPKRVKIQVFQNEKFPPIQNRNPFWCWNGYNKFVFYWSNQLQKENSVACLKSGPQILSTIGYGDTRADVVINENSEQLDDLMDTVKRICPILSGDQIWDATSWIVRRM